MSGALAAWRRLVFTGIPGELFGTFEAKKRLHTSSQKTLLNTIEAAAPMRVRQDVLDNSISDDAFWRLETLRFQGFVGKEQCDAWPDGTAKFEYFLTTVYLKWRQPKENGSSRKALLNVLKRGGGAGLLLIGALQTLPGKQAYSAYVGRYMPWNVSHLSPAELDICDEWLIRITSTDSPEAANDISSKVERAYLDTGETDWEGDVLPVRDPKNFDRWLVVVDANRGRSTKIAVEVTRKEIFDKYPEHDSLRRYLKYAEPFEWSLTDYQRVYGKPDNLPQP